MALAAFDEWTRRFAQHEAKQGIAKGDMPPATRSPRPNNCEAANEPRRNEIASTELLEGNQCFPGRELNRTMARYSKSASNDVKSAMKRRKARTLKSGGSGKTVKSKRQAIAIGLSEARAKGKKVASKKSA